MFGLLHQGETILMFNLLVRERGLSAALRFISVSAKVKFASAGILSSGCRAKDLVV